MANQLLMHATAGNVLLCNMREMLHTIVILLFNVEIFLEKKHIQPTMEL